MDATVVDQPVLEAPIAPGTPAPDTDPFALDEASLVSLSPEQRASLDPILEGWKTRAKSEIDKASKSAEEKYKPVNEKATALDQLVQWGPFQAWWNQQQQAMSQGQSAQTQQAIANAQPQDFATPEEWSQAVLEASNGMPQKLKEINARMFATMATPFVQQFQSKQQELTTKMEMNDLMANHPDYKDLDQIGLKDDGKGISLLEHCLNWAEKEGRPLEEGYQMAKSWADAMGAQKKAEAMGMVQGKKDSITAGPSTASGTGTVVYVDTIQDAMKKSMEAQLEGRKDVRYEVRPPTKK